MNKLNNKNPLFEGQREKAGPKTFDKYSYQYHWALYRVLTKHTSMREYAVFVELHEDVVVSDSLEADSAKFEFNQVKTNKAKFNTNQLVIKKKNGSSVLGKLLNNCINKSYSDKIEEINLVALNKFNLELKQKDVDLEKITIKDLSAKQLNLLEDEIKKEIGKSPIPVNLNFIVPSLSEKNYQNDVISEISKLISSMHPNSRYNSVEIYNLLIDEIYRKGKVTYDYPSWNELINKKALTSETVVELINQFTNIKDEDKIYAEFFQVCTELKMKSIQSKLLQRSFDRYRGKRISNQSTSQLDTSKEIINTIEETLNSGVVEMEQLLSDVKTEMNSKIKQKFNSDSELDAAIICEYIMMN